MKDIATKIREILVNKLSIPETEITPEVHFVKDLGLDSLDYIEVIMEFEQAFSIRIPDTDSQHLITFQKATAYIADKILATTEQSAA